MSILSCVAKLCISFFKTLRIAKTALRNEKFWDSVIELNGLVKLNIEKEEQKDREKLKASLEAENDGDDNDDDDDDDDAEDGKSKKEAKAELWASRRV